MIIEPDFVDHWKTRMLAEVLKDELAPIYLIRLWAHCQQRKTSSFDALPTVALKAICRFPGDADAFEKALSDSGFIARVNGTLSILGWAEYNASLIANWTNGPKGGRPKKVPLVTTPDTPPDTPIADPVTPQITHGLPMANPNETHGVTDREEKRREEKKELPHTPQAGLVRKSNSAISLRTYLEQCKTANAKPIPADDSVFDYADKVGLSKDFLLLHWSEFKDRYTAEGAKRYKSWPSVFGRSVRGNWLKLWYMDNNGGYSLTTVGQQAKRIHGEAI